MNNEKYKSENKKENIKNKDNGYCCQKKKINK